MLWNHHVLDHARDPYFFFNFAKIRGDHARYGPHDPLENFENPSVL